MATQVDDDLSECVGCAATFATASALITHIRTCAGHPLAPDMARLRALEAEVGPLRQAVTAWVAAHRVLAEAVRARSSEIEQWRARWAAERQLYALAGHGAAGAQGEEDDGG